MINTLLLIIMSFLLTGCHFWDRFTFRHGPLPDSEVGVSFYDSSRAQPGVNMVIDTLARACQFIEMTGEHLGSLPGEFCILMPGGQLFTTLPQAALLDAEFKIIWRHPKYIPHHDVVYDEVRDWFWMFVYDRTFKDGKPYVHDRLIALDRKTGEERFNWFPDDHIKDFEKAIGAKLHYKNNKAIPQYHLSHANSISVVPAGAKGAGLPGQILISDSGPMSLLYIVDVDSQKIAWTGIIRNEFGDSPGTHSARYRANGEILLFNNNGDDERKRTELTHSYIGLYDSVKKQFNWKLEQPKGQGMYCEHFGAVEELENGNFLVTHVRTDGKGAAFEITAQGRLVWEWTNPMKHVDGAPVEVYRVSRIRRDAVLPYLAAWKKYGFSAM